jgi:hypothetical protein
MATPRYFELSLEPRHWYAAREHVVCDAEGHFRRAATGASAGSAPRFIRGEVFDGQLRRVRAGYTDLSTALAAAGLTEGDEWTEDAAAAPESDGATSHLASTR